jgi:glyoxylase-like metal-dependent hydrolase (beta-lactamase superfamily II)
MSNRRDFLRTLTGGAAALTLSRSVLAQSAPVSTKLSETVSVISGAGNNVVVLAGDGGNLLVDCGDSAHSPDVLKLAGKVKTVINTHWHPESTGGNDAMAKAGATLVSHVNTKLWMTQEVIHDWEKKTYPARAKQALPTQTFYTTEKTTFGGEPIEYGVMPMAHTDGDIYVYFTKSNVLMTGDAVQPGRLPMLDWFCAGWLGGMQDAHRTLLRIANDDTKVVPANGPVMTKAQLQANLDTVTKIREQMVKLMKQGLGAQDMIAGKAMKEWQGQLQGDPDTFIYTAYRGLWAHARELGGIV